MVIVTVTLSAYGRCVPAGYSFFITGPMSVTNSHYLTFSYWFCQCGGVSVAPSKTGRRCLGKKKILTRYLYGQQMVWRIENQVAVVEKITAFCRNPLLNLLFGKEWLAEPVAAHVENNWGLMQNETIQYDSIEYKGFITVWKECADLRGEEPYERKQQ